MWDGLLDTGRYHRYNVEMRDRLRRKGMTLKFALAFLGLTTGGLSIFSYLPVTEWILPFTGLFITALIVVDFLSDYTREYTLHEFLCAQYSKMENKYRRLWAQMEGGQLSESEVSCQLRELESELESYYRVGKSSLDQELNERCAKEAYKAVCPDYDETA